MRRVLNAIKKLPPEAITNVLVAVIELIDTLIQTFFLEVMFR